MQQQFQEPENTTAATQTRSGVESERQASELEALDPAEQLALPVSPTLRQSSRQVSKWRRRKRLTIGISALLLPISIVCLILIGLLVPTGLPAHIINTIVILCALTLIGSLVGVMIGILMRPMRRNPTNLLWYTDDVQAVGPLLEATGMLMPDVKQRAIEALAPLMTGMKAEDGALLTARQRGCLRRLLGELPLARINYQGTDVVQQLQVESARADVESKLRHQQQFALAALTALTEIGTGQDLPIVQRLAKGNGLAWRDEQVKLAALACLPILTARADEERGSGTYLRAAEPPTSPGDVLLRAAANASETDPHHLLRASDNKPD